MSTLVITPCFYPDTSKLHYLQKSADVFGIELYPFGIGDFWRGTVGGDVYAQYVAAAELLKGMAGDYDRVLFTDGCDTFFCAGLDNINRKYEDIGSDILYSAEPGLYPPHMHDEYNAHKHEHQELTTPWCYPNCGGWIGKTETMIEFLDYMRTHFTNVNEGQPRFVHAYLEDGWPIKLDSECQIFQTMSGGLGDAVEVDAQGMIHNMITKSYPCLVHFNGRLGGIEELFAKRFPDAA